MSHSPLAVLKGKVLHGRGRGHVFGFPTANIPLSATEAIAYGVYFSRVTTENGDSYFAVTNVGVHPTVGALEAPLAEAHLLDGGDDFYGQTIMIELLTFLRAEQTFDDVSELKAQVLRDIANARELAKQRSV